MEVRWGPPVLDETHGHATAIHFGSAGMENATPHGSDKGDVPSMESRQSTFCVGGMDVEECRRKIQLLEVQARETKMREQGILQDLYKAKVRLIEKGGEVCNLQDQIAHEMKESQGLVREILERDVKILHLQAGHQFVVSKTAAESCCSSKVGSSNVASGIRLIPANNSNMNHFTEASRSLQPTLSKQHMKFSPRVDVPQALTAPSSPPVPGRCLLPKCSPKINVLQAVTAPSSPRVSGRYLHPMYSQQMKVPRAVTAPSSPQCSTWAPLPP